MHSKFYAVQRGRVKGIYRSWSECFKQIKGYPNAITDALDYLKWNNAEKLFARNFSNSNMSCVFRDEPHSIVKKSRNSD